MSEKQFTLSNFASPSQLSDVCDRGGKMLNSEVVDLLNEQQVEIERLNKELIKAITKSIPPKKYEDIDKKHKPWKYVNGNCD